MRAWTACLLSLSTVKDGGDLVGWLLGVVGGLVLLPFFYLATFLLWLWDLVTLWTDVAAIRRTGTPYAILAVLLCAAVGA